MKYIRLLLVFLPFAVLGRLFGWSPIVTFAFAGLSIVPLAEIIGEATETLAERIGPRLGGLLNATLGNAAELIIAILALKEGLVELVKASIVGSILGNLLLVTGLSILVGGLRNGIQQFDRRVASTNATLVILSFIAIGVPSLFDIELVEHAHSELLLSEGTAAIMLVLYGLSLTYTMGMPHSRPESDYEPVERPLAATVGVLTAATVGIVIASELLVGSVEPVIEELGWTEFFVGVIIVPIIGNVAEHLVAVQVAADDKMELSLAVSLGSSLQIALFVAPVLVFVSLFFPQKLLLVFNQYELIAVSSASMVIALVSLDGESNWLEGAMLLAVYLILALAFYVLPVGV